MFPGRCAVAPESRHLDADLRHLLFKSHRVIFHVDERKKVVQVLHVRHASRRAVGEPDGDERTSD